MQTSLSSLSSDFQKILKDFCTDITLTFPEYTAIVEKLFREMDENQQDVHDNIQKHCALLTELHKEAILNEDESSIIGSQKMTDFIPGIPFQYLWNCKGVKETTKTTMWRYLQMLLLFFHRDDIIFQDTNTTILEKLEAHFQTLQSKQICDKQKGDNDDNDDNDDDDDDDSENNMMFDNEKTMEKLLSGKLGSFVKEIAASSAECFGTDLEQSKSPQEAFQKMMADPSKIFNVAKDISAKMQSKLKDGDLEHSELLNEASNIMKVMKGIPGLENMEEMVKKFASVVEKDTNTKKAPAASTTSATSRPPTTTPGPKGMSDDELCRLFDQTFTKKGYKRK